MSIVMTLKIQKATLLENFEECSLGTKYIVILYSDFPINYLHSICVMFFEKALRQLSLHNI